MKNGTVNDAGVKFTRYKTCGCLCRNGITYSNVVVIQHNLAIIRRYE